MLHHWLNELMNLLAGNSRYRHYSPAAQRAFGFGFLIFLLLPPFVSFVFLITHPA